MMSIIVRLLFTLVVGLIGKKLTFAIAVMVVGLNAARASGAGRSLKRARAWLRSRRRVRRADAEGST